MLDAIKEEDVKSFATEMSAELSESNNEMICGGQSTCEDLVSFKAQVAKENVEAGGLPPFSDFILKSGELKEVVTKLLVT